MIVLLLLATNIPMRIAAFLIFCLGLSGCSKEETPPADTLPENKMAAILADIHVAESRVNRLQLRSLDSSLLIFGRLKADIWKKHKVDTLVYNKSYSYYMSHPQIMTRIYEKVNKNIEVREKKKDIKL